ncbi:MAG: CvpA family protein, partial [Clostridia bacterium]|nr:CvpA family protein [Clostridia bacterium]
LTILFYKPVAALIKGLHLLANMVTEFEIPDLAAGEDLMGKIKILMHYIIENEDIEATTEAIVNNLIADVASIAISFVLLFVGLLLIIKLVFKLLDVFAKAPVLKQANGILGGVVGVCEGLFWCWIFALVFGGFLFPTLSASFPELFTEAMLESVVYKICTEFNPIAFILSLIQLIV